MAVHNTTTMTLAQLKCFTSKLQQNICKNFDITVTYATFLTLVNFNNIYLALGNELDLILGGLGSDLTQGTER